MAACRALLRGGSKSFDAAAKLLPRAVRDPAIALYAFCREADDAIDGGTGGLDWLRERLALAYAGRPLALSRRIAPSPGSSSASPSRVPCRRRCWRGLPGTPRDAAIKILPELRAYAVRVAGSVGAMMAVVMGVRDPKRLAAAVDLGVAMQLSNIARDVGEDARNGRLYLPLDWLAEAGIDPDLFLDNPRHSPALAASSAGCWKPRTQHYHQPRAGIARLPLRLPVRHWRRGTALCRNRA